jgi:DNA recombination protein RmuC
MIAVLSAIAGASVAAFAVYAVMRSKLAKAEMECSRNSMALELERRRIEDMHRHYEEIHAQGESQFKALAQKILEERSEKLKSEGADQLKGIVNPLLENIKEFRKKIEASDVATAERNTELKTKIENLVAQTNAVTAQANNLADAIRGDAQFSGEWGEIQLKKVLELAGFTETVDYTYQETFEDASGRKAKRTDVVIKMPGNRSLIVDSKATISAAVEYHAASTVEEKKAFCDRLVDSVRKHVDEIGSAEYQSFVPNAFPTVLMYIPLEEVYMIAMKAQISVSGTRELLRDYARRKNVVFVNAASVVPVVRLIEMMWSVERSEKNRQEVARAAEELLLRANGFIKDFMEVGAAFDAMKAKYDSARVALIDARGGHSIAKAAAKLVKLGTKPKTRGGKDYQLVADIAAELEDTGSIVS